MRTTRSSIAEVLALDFIQTLRAKGLGRTAIVMHAIRNALPQILAMGGLQIGYLIGGSILVETVFTWPGTGFLLNKAILTRDIPLLQGTILVLAMAFVAINLVVDLMQTVVDPRIKRGMSDLSIPSTRASDASRRDRWRVPQVARLLGQRLAAASLRLRDVVLPGADHADHAVGGIRALACAVRSRQGQYGSPAEAAVLSRQYPGHRRAGAGHAVAHALWRPHVVADGHRAGDAGHGRRRLVRRRRRVRRRLAQHADHARHGHVLRVSLGAAGCGDFRQSGRRHDQPAHYADAWCSRRRSAAWRRPRRARSAAWISSTPRAPPAPRRCRSCSTTSLVNAVSPVLVYASTLVSASILLASGLSFLGLGVSPPTPDWGLMLSTLAPGDLRAAGGLRDAGRRDLDHLAVLQPGQRRAAPGDGRQGMSRRARSNDNCSPPPTADQPADRGGKAQPMLIAQDLQRYFPIRGGILNRKVAEVKAVDDVSFTVLKGETLGVVGESGCGKSTLARLLMHLLARDAGELIFDGDPVGAASGLPLRDLRRNMQMVFQDSYSSLNPRLPVEESIAYAPRVHGMERPRRGSTARELLQRVGLRPEHFGGRYPHELSGGQKQRVNIARALALESAHADPGRGGLGARQIGRGAGAQPARPAEARRST